jgi:hypothetical protein
MTMKINESKINESTPEIEVLNRVFLALELLKRNTANAKRKQAISKALKAFYRDNPQAATKKSLDNKAWWSKSENRKRMCDIFSGPEHRMKRSEQWTAYYANPENYEVLIKRMHDPDFRKRLSVAVKTSWDTGLLLKYRRLRKRKHRSQNY